MVWLWSYQGVVAGGIIEEKSSGVAVIRVGDRGELGRSPRKREEGNKKNKRRKKRRRKKKKGVEGRMRKGEERRGVGISV